MTQIDSNDYVERRTTRKTTRNWWLIKCNSSNRGYVCLNRIFFPKEMIGKKVRFKMEIMEDENNVKEK